MGLKVRIGVVHDKKNNKIYRPGDSLPSDLIKGKALDAALEAGSIVETGSKSKPEPKGDK